MFQEFPKCLYRYPATTGQKTDIEGEAFDYCFVADENAELASVAEGWTLVPTIPVAMLTQEADAEPAKAKPGRPKKVEPA